jgi:hypothetical protein
MSGVGKIQTKNVGSVYCLTNPSMPDICKIGMTDRRVEERVEELSNTSVPTPFEVAFAKLVNNPKQKEKMIHKLLSAHRINKKREFFNYPLDKVKQIFDLIDEVEVPIENEEEKEEECVVEQQQPRENRVSPFTLSRIRERRAAANTSDYYYELVECE